MSVCTFVGDELTGAGFRLAGARVYSPPATEIEPLFRQLCRECELLILTAEAAAEVPETLLLRTTTAGRPLLLVVPDARERRQPEDLAVLLRGKLGMGE